MQKVLRVVQVIASVDPTFGGPSIGATNLNRALNGLGVSSVLLAARYPVGPISMQNQPSLGEASQAPLGTFAPSRPYSLKASRGLKRAIFDAAESADLIHIHGQFLLPNIYAYRAAKKFRKPYGIQPHGTTEPYQRRRSSIRKRIFNFVLGKRILTGAAYVCFAADSEADGAADIVRTNQRLICPLGATLDESEIHEPLSAAIGSTPREKCFVYLGRLAAKKRPDVLVRAWALSGCASRGGKLIVAGPDDDFLARDLDALSRELGTADSVVFPGAVNDGHKSWLLRRCGIFVLVSENENFAIAVAEAMLAGCYVITSDRVAAAEHVRSAGYGQVLSDLSEHALASAMRDAFRSDLTEGSTSGIEYAEENLSWDKMAQCIIARRVMADTLEEK